MYDPRDYDLVFAIVLLTVVIAILGAPFSWNEYNKWIDREKITRNFRNIFPENAPAGQIPLATAIPYAQTFQPRPRPPAPAPAPVISHAITEGFWCRDTTVNIGKAPTNVKECYQFLPDGTFKWGYSPGYPLGKSPSCWAPDIQCRYSLVAGRYEVQGGYRYFLTGNTLLDPLDPPYFTWTSAGIP